MVFPGVAKRADPGVDIREGRRIESIKPPLAIDSNAYEAVVPQHLEMLRNARLRNPELALDGLNERTGRVFARANHLQDSPPHRVAENIECVHPGAPV